MYYTVCGMYSNLMYQHRDLYRLTSTNSLNTPCPNPPLSTPGVGTIRARAKETSMASGNYIKRLWPKTSIKT